jgi:hypothetical protein
LLLSDYQFAYIINELPTPKAAKMPTKTEMMMAAVYELLSWHLPSLSYLPLAHSLQVVLLSHVTHPFINILHSWHVRSFKGK